jgi:hypothetical protein
MNGQHLLVLVILLGAGGANARDVDGDGIVDDADLRILRDAFHTYDTRADLNGDGRVNFADLALLRAERDGHGRPVTTAALPTMTLLPGAQDVPFLNELVLELWMDFTAEPTLGGGTDIHFDAAALRYLSFEFDPGLGDDPAFRRVPDLDAPGELNALAFGNFDGLTGPALVGRFTFRAGGTAGVTSLTMTADDLDGVAGPFVSAIDFLPMDVDFIGADVNVVEGPLPVIDVDPRLVRFATIRVGHREPRRVTVSNAGEVALRIGIVGAVNPLDTPFRIEGDNCSMRTLPPGEQCGITLGMNPPVPGEFSDAFSISSGDPVTPVITVGVMGVGTEQLGIDAIGFDEGTVTCENHATGLVVTRLANRGGRLNCEAEGFHATPNAPVTVSFGGLALVDARAGGIAKGQTVGSVRCENIRTGQRIDIDQPADRRDWNCVNAGLVVTAGDDILMFATGIAD